jgi:hypothetical protein
MNRHFFFAFASFVLIILAPHVVALTASPAAKTILFEPNAIERYDITITNDETRTLSIAVTPTGPFADFIDVPTAIELEPGTSRTLGVRVRLPQDSQPGTIESGVLIEARPVGGGTVSASAAVLHLIRVQTPYEGAFLSGQLLTSSGIVGSEVLLTLSLVNTGSELVTTTPSIFLDGERRTLPEITLAPGATRDTSISWTPKAVGVYTASASVAYADKENRFSQTIVVGNLSVRITDIEYGAFQLGDPFRVSATVLNEWGASLPVQAIVTLEQNGATIGSAPAQGRVVSPLAEERLTAFVESAGASVGAATITVRISYAEKTLEQAYPVVLGVDSITPYEPRTAVTPIWIIVLAFVVLVLAATYFIYKKRALRG